MPAPLPSPVRENVATLSKLVGLSAVETDVLGFVLMVATESRLSVLAGELGMLTLRRTAEVIATALATDVEAVCTALAPRGRLLASSLLWIDDDLAQLSSKVQPTSSLLDLVHLPGLDASALLERFVDRALPPTLGRSDFAHLEGYDTALALLRRALETRRPGVNILLYGATGTGKTELARHLASELNVPLYVAGAVRDNGSSISGPERLGSLRLAYRLLGDRSALTLFDEVEDLFEEQANVFGPARRRTFSKLWFNELLESNPLPTLWISNDVDCLDPAYLRRFAFVLPFRSLGIRQRRTVLERAQSTLEPLDVQAVAERFDAAPAQLTSAIATAQLLSAEGRLDRETVERVLRPSVELLTGRDPAKISVFDPRRYRPSAIHCVDDLGALADRLAGWTPSSEPGLSLCLYGPPGTGKTEYARYLAHRMGRPVLHKRPSDLLSKWVGGTEQQLAAAFRQAEDDDALLLLDEVDTLLRDRRSAQQSWEVSQVNELLQQLESFRGVVVCTTNLWRDLDEASLRRFVFKLEFKPLRVEQAAALFLSLLEPFCAEAVELETITRLLAPLSLTPGDLAAVRRRLQLQQARLTFEEVLAQLTAEVRAKPRAAGTIGLRPSARA